MLLKRTASDEDYTRIGAPVWITEAGPKYHHFGLDNDARSVEDTQKLVSLPSIGTRIKRFSYYSMYGAKPQPGFFDSGMVHPAREDTFPAGTFADGALRDAYCTCAQKVRADYPAGLTRCQQSRHAETTGAHYGFHRAWD